MFVYSKWFHYNVIVSEWVSENISDNKLTLYESKNKRKKVT